MSDFAPYPGPTTADPGSPDDRYVVAVTCSLDQGLAAPGPITAPMTHEQAQDLLAQIAAGEPCEVLTDEVDLVAEVGPGHLVAYRDSSMLRKAATYDVRLARVVFSR